MWFHCPTLAQNMNVIYRVTLTLDRNLRRTMYFVHRLQVETKLTVNLPDKNPLDFLKLFVDDDFLNE